MALILPYKQWRPRLGSGTFLADNVTVIGNVEIGVDANLWFGTVVRGDVGAIHIGARTNIQDNCVVHVTGGQWDTWIGDDVVIGHAVVLHGCRLENASFVGMKALVLDGCVVESGGMVAGGAVLPPGKRVKRGELWAGNPAKYLRQLTAEETGYIEYAKQVYLDLAAEYRRNGVLAPQQGADR
jgi:carbonic anhydrase/acetyltransferase-like protein (isoleucine patch superfamily)